MLDIKVIRENPELVKERLANRHDGSADLIDEVLACDETRRKNETAKQVLQSERKATSKEIGKLRANGEDSSGIEAEVKKIGEQIKALDDEGSKAAKRQNELLLNIPNLPHEDCPVGADEDANPIIRSWGEKPALAEARDHLDLAEEKGFISFDDGARLSGAGFAVYRGKGARLQRALIQFLLDLQSRENGYEEVNVPHIIKRECMEGTGQLPKFEDDMYGTENNEFFLAPTAEVPVTNLYRDTLLAESELPIKMTAHTPCFRREAGSAGRDNRGIIRMHQFDKVELVQIVDPATSMAVLEELTGHAEAALQKLGLHYQVIELCTGDVGFSSCKTYDIEVWAPGQGKYLEVSSCSCFGDYQARRMKLRYKDAEGKNIFCHTLNGSGTALPRLLVALLEQCQDSDGTIHIPEALQLYYGEATL
ncbi:serine--tRNA ligase [Akkermansiaceae bacterium]|nr:serine--tRNA ligase [Akkermansiaceae bacterium]MDB4509936.1 serine--tRNA ligase [Akkermansiaceae bacterium]